jgi:threonine synthase
MSDSATPVGLAVPTRKPAPAPTEEPKDETHTPSQRYLSTRGGSYGVRNLI